MVESNDREQTKLIWISQRAHDLLRVQSAIENTTMKELADRILVERLETMVPATLKLTTD